MSRAKLIESTKSRPAKFFTNDQAEIKRMTIEAYNNGVQSVKNQNWKYYKFKEEIGAKKGEATSYMRVESTAATDGLPTVHGHPVTKAEYKEHTTIKIKEE